MSTLQKYNSIKPTNQSLDTFLTHEDQNLQSHMFKPIQSSQDEREYFHQQIYLKHDRQEANMFSVSKYYQNLKMSLNKMTFKNHFPYINLPRYIDPYEDELLSCFCGKIYKFKGHLVLHIQKQHGHHFDSIEYVLSDIFLSQNKLTSKKFFQERLFFISQLKTKPYHKIRFLAEMYEMIPKVLQKHIRHKLFQLQSKVFNEQDYFGFKKIAHRKQWFFSEDFMEVIRSMMLKYCTSFNRCITFYIHNFCIKQMVFFIIFCFVPELELLKKKQLKKKNQLEFFNLCKLLQAFVWYLLRWIDKNFHKIFFKHSILYPHVQIGYNETYTSTQQFWHFDLLLQEFQVHCQSSVPGKQQKIICSFLLEILKKFQDIWQEKDQDEESLHNKKHKGE